MKSVKFSEDIVPIGEFKSHSAHWLEKIKTSGQPIVITQNGKPAGVIISPSDFDRLKEREAFIHSVEQGLADADAGDVFSTKELKNRTDKRRKKAG